MSQRTRKERIQAISAAYDAGQAYCPSCGTPLNYHRSGLPNSAAFNPATDIITCSRCSRIAQSNEEPPATLLGPDSIITFAGLRSPHTSKRSTTHGH